MMADRAGQQIGNYQLVRLLGAGAFGEVYLGEHKSHKTQAAIKVLPQLARDDDLQDFLNEARTVLLKHFNIVQVLDFGVEKRTPYIVMEYAPNGTLRQHHPRGTRIPLLTVVSYIKQLAGALQYAHDREIIHRDVKPENMLIGEQNQILLSDFGIATIARSTASQRDERVVGTILYMAPEQIKAHPRPASDQYSLGVVVYEWLCDECPFSGGALQLMYQHVEVPPPPLHKKVPTILPDVEQVVMTALAKDPKQRFASVLAFATALEQASQPKMHCPASDQYFLGVLVYEWRCGERPFQGTRIEVAAISPEVEEVSADTPAQPHDLVPVPSDGASAPAPGPPSRQGNGPMVQPEPEPAQPWISRRKVVLGLGSLAGLAVLAVASGIARWASSRGLQPPVVSGQTPIHPSPTALVSPTPTPVPPCPPFAQSHTYCGHTGEVNTVAWSPDGTRIASGGRDNTVQVWDSITGKTLLPYRGHTSWVDAVAWSSDSKYIASGSYDKTVRVWDAATGSLVATFKGHTASVHAVAWSPDGQRIASGSDDNTVQVWDAATGGFLFRYNHSNWVHAVAWSPDGKYIASGSTDTTVQVWEWDASTNTGRLLLTYRGHTAEVDAVAWSPDSSRIVSGSLDVTAQVWDAVSGGHNFIYRQHTGQVLSVAWSPDGMHIASGSSDNTAQVWSPPMQQPIFTFSDHTNWVYAVSWSPDNKHVASASADDTVRIWES